jgi:hypothetical protein
MNTTFNVTLPYFTWTISDTVFTSLQISNFLIFFMVGILLFVFRKENPIKYRGILPIASFSGLFVNAARIMIGNYTFTKVTNPTSFTHR